jgi:hypothetical protein
MYGTRPAFVLAGYQGLRLRRCLCPDSAASATVVDARSNKVRDLPLGS